MTSILATGTAMRHGIDRAFLWRGRCNARRHGERWLLMGTSMRPQAEPPARRTSLIRRRTAQGLSQERLAEQLGVDRTTVARWEAGTSAPQPWQRPNLAQALGITLAECDALLRPASRGPSTDTVQAEPSDPDGGAEMQRRNLLTATAAHAVGAAACTRLVEALLIAVNATPLTLHQLALGVRHVKTA
jgi:transcriptional regulator with XRE-family HTH domain